MQKGQVIKATDFLRAIDDKIIGKVDTTLTLTAGTGLSGGGNLTANRTFNFDTTWGDNRYTVSSRTISTGDGLSGGGNLTANRTLTVDSTVVRTSRNLTAGTGISGGGNLSADRTFSFDTTWGDTRYSLSGHNHNSLYALLTTSISAGTGLSGGGNLTANRTINFDTTWGDARYSLSGHNHDTRYVNLSGDTMTGDLTFGGSEHRSLIFATSRIRDNTSGSLVISSTGTQRSIFLRPNGNENTNNQLSLTENTLSYTGTFSVTGSASFSGVVSIAQATGTGHAVRADRSISTGDGLSGGGNLTANRTISFDTTWGDGRYVIHGRSVSAGNGLTGGGDLSANRTVTLGTPSTLNGTTTNAVTSDSHTHNIDATDSRTNSSTATLLNAKAMNDHRTSGDHDGRYFVKHQGSITDFNTALTEGGYLVNGTASNAPHTGAIWGKLVVYVSDGGTHNNSNNWIWQFFESTNNTSWSRVKVNAEAWRAWRQHWNSHSFDPSSKADTTVTVSAGTGLSGGGTIAANRTLSFDTTWGDNRYTLSSRTITAGDGLSGGGDLTANRTLAVDSTVVRTSRTLTAGTGITGGGDLSANRSFAFDTTWGDNRYSLSGHHHDSRYVNQSSGVVTDAIEFNSGTSETSNLTFRRTGNNAVNYGINFSWGGFGIVQRGATGSGTLFHFDSNGNMHIGRIASSHEEKLVVDGNIRSDRLRMSAGQLGGWDTNVILDANNDIRLRPGGSTSDGLRVFSDRSVRVYNGLGINRATSRRDIALEMMATDSNGNSTNPMHFRKRTTSNDFEWVWEIDTSVNRWFYLRGTGSGTFNIDCDGHGRFARAWDHDVGSVTRRAVWMDAQGTMGHTASTKRVKQDIRPTLLDPKKVLDIEVVDFRYIKQVEEEGDRAPFDIGVIAEQIDELGLKQFVFYGNDGQPEGVHYEMMAMALLPVVQEQQKQIDEQQKLLANLLARVEQLESK